MTDGLRSAGLLLLGCASRSPASPGVATPEELTEVAAAGAGAADGSTTNTHRLSFVVSIETACSQSWDYTTYTGDLALSLDRRGRALAELTVRSRSVGPGAAGNFQVTEAGHACAWDGTVSEQGDAWVITLRARDAAREPYVCAIGGSTLGSRPLEFQLRCLPVPRGDWPQRSLACTPLASPPWFLGLLRIGGVIPLGGPDLILEANLGDVFGS